MPLAGRAFHQVHVPTPVCIVLDPEIAAAVIIARIRENERGRGVGSYLFVDRDSKAAYVVAEQSSFASFILATFDTSPWFPWFVGFYRSRRRPGMAPLRPTLQGVAEDLAEHLALR